MRIIRLADCPETPWASGRGVTRQLLRDDAEQDAWTWRLSVATVGEPGPFSSLPGVDRVLVCAGDTALSLLIDGRAQEARPGHPIRFAGEADVVSLGTAATRDVNVMVRRNAAIASTEVVEAGGPILHEADSEVTAYIALADGTLIGDHRLAIGDTLVVDEAVPEAASVSRGRCLRVAIRLR